MKMKDRIIIPEDVDIKIEDSYVIITGPKGNVSKKIPAIVKRENNSIIVVSENKALRNTSLALIRSSITGVTQGFKKRMQILYSHFPITIEVKGGEIYIKNFLGEKIPRIATLVGNTTVKTEKDIVIVAGVDAYEVGQTVANIIKATKIRYKDPRVFQDGIYVID